MRAKPRIAPRELGDRNIMNQSNVPSYLDEERFPGNVAAYTELRQVLNHDSIVAFTGAGTSAPLFPTWTGALSTLIHEAYAQKFIRDDAELAEYKRQIETDPLELALLLEEAFTKQVFRSRLAKMFRGDKHTCTGTHDHIVRLKLRGIITLNYDDGLEIACVKQHGHFPTTIRGGDSTELVRWLQGDIDQQERPILHLHGTISDPYEMVFTSSDYDAFYSNRRFEDFIRQMWQVNRLLVIGFGFTDPFLTRVAENSLRSLPTDIRHFALIGKRAGETVSPITRRNFARKYRLTPIFYEIQVVAGADGHAVEDHSQLTQLLKSLNEPNPDEQQSIPTMVPASSPSAPTKLNNADGHSRDVVKSNSATEDFEQHLFAAPNGSILYVEPRLQSARVGTDLVEDMENEPVSISEIVSSTNSYIITTRNEYGATTLGRKLLAEMTASSHISFFRDATSLPNYKRKLQSEFSSVVRKETFKSVLIIDNIDFARDERLLKEISGADLFDQLIVLAHIGGSMNDGPVPVELFSADVKMVQLDHLERPDIRTLATIMFDTADTDHVSSIVEKVYSDLLALCIPLTPSNIIMYLTILYKEGDFDPLNRVQIVDRYVRELLRHPSDAYSSSFNAKNKIDVLSAFVHHLYSTNKTVLTSNEWHTFCQSYKNSSLIDFDENKLLTELLTKRIIVQYGQSLAFKYKLFYVYFLGRYVSSRPNLLNVFIENDSYMDAEGLVEVIAELSSDNTTLVTRIVEKLEEDLEIFEIDYVPLTFDIFEKLEWRDNPEEENKLWKVLSEKIADGPRKTCEIDLIKRSVIAETLTYDQTVTIRRYDNLGRKLFLHNSALLSVLKSIDNLDGELKKRAIKAVYSAALKVMQISVIHAHDIIKHPYYFIHGLLFIRLGGEWATNDEDERASLFSLYMLNAVVSRTSDIIGSRKLGEVFRALELGNDLSGFRRYVNYACIIRAKPRNWGSLAEQVIVNSDRNSYYLSKILDATFKQFKDEVNTVRERDELKRLVAVIQTKRVTRKKEPSSRAVMKMLKNPKFLKSIIQSNQSSPKSAD